jgi:hypothetical protein
MKFFHQKVRGVLFIISALLLFLPMIALAGEDISTLRFQAIKGDANAQYKIGRCYLFGIGVPENDIKALYWTRLSAKQKNPFGQDLLGEIYKDGFGVPKDYGQALHWFRLAANQGNVLAELDLGDMYQYGRGVPKDYGQALHWFHLAANQGNAIAEFDLGMLYVDFAEYLVHANPKPGEVATSELEDKVDSLLRKARKWGTLAKNSHNKDVYKSAVGFLKGLGAIKEQLDHVAMLDPVERYAAIENDKASIHIPSHCSSKEAIQEEKEEIPQILGYSPSNEPYITNIEVLGDIPRQMYTSSFPLRGHYKLYCVINVQWNNGNIEKGRTFTIWHDPNGETMASYGHYGQ